MSSSGPPLRCAVDGHARDLTCAVGAIPLAISHALAVLGEHHGALAAVRARRAVAVLDERLEAAGAHRGLVRACGTALAVPVALVGLLALVLGRISDEQREAPLVALYLASCSAAATQASPTNTVRDVCAAIRASSRRDTRHDPSSSRSRVPSGGSDLLIPVGRRR